MAAPTSVSPSGRSSPLKKFHWVKTREQLTGCLFVLPAFLIIGLFGLFPIGFAVYVSLHRWRITQGRFLGLDNYVKALDNLAYVVFFWVAALVLFLAIRSLGKLLKRSGANGGNPWPWLFPALMTAVGVGQFLRFVIFLLPEILNVAEKMKGQGRTREVFLQYLGSAWRLPQVQSAFWSSLVILVLAQVLAYLVYRFLSKKL